MLLRWCLQTPVQLSRTFKYEDLILLHLVYFQLVKVGDGNTKTWNYEVKPFTCVMNLSLFFYI